MNNDDDDVYSIMVLDAGRMIEFDPPGDLLNNKTTVFYSMANDAGLTNWTRKHFFKVNCDNM